MMNCRVGLSAIASSLLLVHTLNAASVGPSGYTNDFATQPLATDWATFTVPGGTGDAYELDADVNVAISPNNVTNITLTGANPPSPALRGVWSTNGFFLATRPGAASRYVALMGKFVNSSGSNATQIAISYLFTIAGNAVAEESGLGTRVYYSLSGANGSWINLPTLNSSATNGSGVVGTNLTLDWPGGSPLYLLWADDNTSAGNDVANEIDNFSLLINAGTAGPLIVSHTPANGASIPFGKPVVLEANPIGGSSPYNVTFYTNGQLVSSVAVPLYSANIGVLPVGTYTSYVQATDSSAGTPQQAVSTTNAFSIVPNPLSVTLTSPTNTQAASGGQPFTISASTSVQAPVAVTNVEFFVDGVSVGIDTAAPFSVVLVSPKAGDHTFYAAAIDTLGRKSFSTTNTANFAAGALGTDNFADRVSLSTPASAIGSSVGATTEPGEPAQFFQPPRAFAQWGATLWWKWVAPFSGIVTIDTIGSDFNTYLAVYTGTNNPLAVVAQNDNAPGSTDVSLVSFTAEQDVEYQIQVGGTRAGFNGPPAPTGNVRLNLSMPAFVSITAPVQGATFLVGSNITVNAVASSVVGTISGVGLYRGSTLLGTDNSAPYSFVVSNAPAGTNALYTVATDNLGQLSTSAVVRVFVANIGVTITSPSEDAVFLSSTNPISVAAFTTLLSGSITNVSFFLDGQLIGSDGTPPFSVLLSNAPPGSHRLTAVGVSDSGNTYFATPVNFGVARALMAYGSVWKYLDDGSDQGTNWITSDFNDSFWASGPAPLGYSDSNGRAPATTNSFGPDVNNKFRTTYFRQTIVVTNTASFTNITMNLERDDGAIIYLNGAELARFNMPTGAVSYTNFAAVNAFDDGSEVQTFSFNASRLAVGTNVVAVEIHQDSGNSSDIWFRMELIGNPIIIHNQSPTVAITNPTNNHFFLAPSSITIQANASDADGTVAKVEFFVDGVRFSERTNAPYSSVWNNPPIGPHDIYAIATDNGGAIQQSATAHVDVYNAEGTPFAQITTPTNGVTIEGGTNLVVSAYANAPNGITNVQFVSNGTMIGNDTTAPFSIVWNAPFATNRLTTVVSDASGVRATSAMVTITVVPNTTPPRVATQSPLPSVDLTNFTSLRVIFTEPVQGLDAGDLLVSGIPATNVTGSGSNYFFTFPQPFYGEVEIAFANGHGITDFGYPSNLAFNALSPDAQWEYDLIDRTPPFIVGRSPAAGSTVTNLTQISVAFSEVVTNVDAADLLVNSTPALSVSRNGTNYVFTVAQPASGTVTVSWATNHSISDIVLEPPPNLLNGAASGWTFTLDARTILLQTNSTWKYLKGLAEASSPTDAWRQFVFDDSSWSSGPAPLVFGEATFTNAAFTDLSDMGNNGYSSIYLRKMFFVPNLGAVTNLLMAHQSDDGFIAWINGTEAFRYNMPTGAIAFNGGASAQALEPANAGPAYISVLLTNAVFALVPGTNILTVHAFNVISTPASSDFVFNAQLYTYLADAAATAPRIAQADPAQGDVLSLTNLTINFSEGVGGVNAGDLLVNGVPATSLSSTTNTTYTFRFPQPTYGSVVLNWATDHGIADMDMVPKPFDATAGSATLRYTLINPSNPRIVSQTPAASTTITGLTSIAVAFTEPVNGITASDLLVSGVPASGVTGSGSNYVFTLAQPPFGNVTVRWATNHGIVDLETPANSFDPTRFGGQWSYTLIDPRPSVALTTPTNGTFILPTNVVTLRASASDRDGTIARVEFFSGTTSLGQGTNAANTQYTLVWSNIPLGSYTVRAVATDNTGISSTSAPAILNVVTNLPMAVTRGPYLQSGSTTGAVVRWRTDRFSDGVVRYGVTLDAMTNTAVQGSVTNEHIVTLAGLQPETKYFYEIASSMESLAGGTNTAGSNYWFKTSPPVGAHRPIRFWVLGDAGTVNLGNPGQAAVRDAYYNYARTNGAADIWLMLGDNAYNSGTDAEHQTAVFDMYPGTLRNHFLWPTIGNHETSQSRDTNFSYPYLDIFSLPQNGEAGGIPSGTEKYFSFDYANVHFVCLDSMTSGITTNTAMARWLRNDLENSVQEWTVVYFHHPPYTKGSHNSDTESDLVQIRENLVPILEEFGVDLVLSGHSHCLERSFLLDRQYGLSTTLTATNKIDAGDGREDGTGAYRKDDEGRGVVYIVAGSSGQATGGTLNHPAHFISLNELGSLVVDVNGGRMDVKFLTSGGEFHDHFTLRKDGVAPVTAPISIAINGSGTVTGVTNGQLLRIGQSYTVLATPGSNSFFVNWSGAAPEASATLRFVMQSNLVITANFATGAAPANASLTLTINGNGSVLGATNGQSLLLGQSYTLTAVAGADSIFTNWSGDVAETGPTLNFVMQSNLVIVANFVPIGGGGSETNVFTPVAAVFNGLYFDTNQLAADRAGFFTLRMTSAGRYNATLRSLGKKYLTAGAFGVDGRATNSIRRANANPLSVVWEVNLQDPDLLSGSVSDGEWTAQLLGDRDLFDARNSAPQAGKYTMIISGDSDATDAPAGDGYGAIGIGNDGRIHLNGKAADGSVLMQNVSLSKNGDWPMFVSLYNGRGVMLGWVRFADDGANDLSGKLRWIKPALPTSKLYPDGFAILTDAIGSHYAPPTPGQSVLQLTDGFVMLEGGELPEIANPVTLGPNSKLVNNGPNTLKLKFTPASGILSGTFREAGAAQIFPIKGVVLQRQNTASGYAPGARQSGRVSLQAVP